MLDDSDLVEGEYFMDVMPLPKTLNEAERLARQFEEDASRWANYDYDDEEDEDEEQEADGDTADVTPTYDAASMGYRPPGRGEGDNSDQKFGLEFPNPEGGPASKAESPSAVT